ncbi:MAG: hypothetical protein JSR34_03370 [Proteobacteria bacterium]|nr:hypothetical protein [Pseudomonadota bacterium]
MSEVLGMVFAITFARRAFILNARIAPSGRIENFWLRRGGRVASPQRRWTRFRKIVKACDRFPSGAAATCLIWITLCSIAADWSRSATRWQDAMNPFAMRYEERLAAARI